ncbi:LLM class flavin-dependent oxidoreductase [Paracnuella aquatica]|uniref:LLM class flavin-dependent oxidoreductase n=1 Tax=Paracnuella aquatica TaxID=2268757 RepID=UPI001F4ED755|nr:LLM class flavin-dependent oxidoreductase [Paracnuella aquatica]
MRFSGKRDALLQRALFFLQLYSSIAASNGHNIMEIGVYTFADIGRHPETGEELGAQQRLANLMEEVKLADEVGLDVFAIGEHHRPDYAVSAPAVALAAAAAHSKNIRLSSAVTVLSSEDPVRVYQQFATVDLISGGRAEIMAGRGSFIESFPLFGHKLEDYDELFAEKLAMLVHINNSGEVTWSGKHTQPLHKQHIYPKPVRGKLPIWVAVGGTPESVVRAADYGLPMALAIIGGQPARFAPFAKLYRELYQKAGHAAPMQLGINSHAYIAENSQAARNEFYPTYAASMNRIGRERGWPPSSRQQFDQSTGPHGALLVGSPQEVIDKILYEHELFGHTRFLAQMDVGALPHKYLMRSIELLGTVVAPAVRKALGVEKSVKTAS